MNEMQALFEKMADANVIVEKVFHLPVMQIDWHIASELEDLLTEYGEPWEAMGLPIPDDLDDEECIRILRQEMKTGFLIVISTPVRLIEHGDSFSFSWGITQQSFIYGETLESCYEQSLKYGFLITDES